MPPDETAPRWDAVLLDLDGTLTDSARAVTSSVAAALRAVGAEVPDADGLLAYVGPPLRVGLEKIAGLDEPDVVRALQAYRAVYGGGRLFDVDVFDKMPHLLEGLRAAGMPVALATSKGADYARRILEHLNLAEYFAVIAGARPDGSRATKAEVIDEAVRGLADLGHTTDEIVMVGDREHDVEGAARWGIPCIIVRWGYGRDAESEGAYAVVHSVEELARELGVTLVDAGPPR